MRILIWTLLCLASFILPISSIATTKSAVLLDVTGAMGPATQDFVQRGLEEAIQQKAELVILRLDTPGGLATSMRGINRAILASPIPIITFVAPSGAHAASAGTFILYASHIAAMAPGTNLGAASPVSISETSLSSGESRTNKTQQTILQKKELNDAVAYIRSLAELRHRNAAWGELAVREAVSLPAADALQQNVINLIANDIPNLLQQLNGHSVQVQNSPYRLQTQDIVIKTFKPDWRVKFLSIITDPSVAYILLLIGIYGLFFELANPGLILPGIVGVIALLIALYALQLLPISYAGLSLLLVGIACMVVEVFISSFGVIGVGGVIAFIAGSIMLFDTNTPGYTIAWSVIIAMSLVSIGFFFLILWLTIGSLRKSVVTGREALIGSEGEVIEYAKDHILIRVLGEIWNAQSAQALHPGQKVRVTHIEDLNLTVEPITKPEK